MDWKEGQIRSSIPIHDEIGSFNSYQKLKLSKDARQFILQNIQHEDLIASLLASAEESAVLEGISSYKCPNTDEEKALMNGMKNLENATVAGIKVVALFLILDRIDRLDLGESFGSS